ncbi:cytochrome c [Methylophaga sp.]|uniref:c-type cytochrome n=1 Tax=Methylophaga sp. TaxID=2024840 RepID=UPI002723034D|nr:cytochrome c [Methylophaga sp.]MDO8827238.1 cytochrome c [Methylophaga sp.]
MKKNILKPSVLAIMASLLAFSAFSHADDKPYTVTDGHALDSETFNGYKLYRNWCARCHGTVAQGMVGPNLAESLNVISKDEFITTVAKGKMGQIGMMPGWESNAQVMEGMDQIYAYLKARADGAIGEVKPTKAK